MDCYLWLHCIPSIYLLNLYLLQVEFSETGICHGFVIWIDWVMDARNSVVLSTGPGIIYSSVGEIELELGLSITATLPRCAYQIWTMQPFWKNKISNYLWGYCKNCPPWSYNVVICIQMRGTGSKEWNSLHSQWQSKPGDHLQVNIYIQRSKHPLIHQPANLPSAMPSHNA